MIDLKQHLKNSELTVGSWITLPDSSAVEIMARAGFDWLTVDMEHSAITLHQAQQIIQIIELNGVVPLVRVEENSHNYIKRVMDAGAHGVIVPMVNTAEEAKRAVAAVKYPPLGSRGFGLARAQRYSLDLKSYVKWNQGKSVVIVQIEHIRAVENLEKILTVEGVDAFLVGPYDLSGSLGVPGEFEDQRVIEALQEIMRVSARLNLTSGYHVVSLDTSLVMDKIDEGYTFIAYGVDFLFLGETCRNGLIRIGTELRDRGMTR